MFHGHFRQLNCPGDAWRALFSTHGLALLRLIGSADLIAYCHAELLRALCSDAGLLCLRDGLLTLPQLNMFDGDALQALFSTHGLALLRLVRSADLIADLIVCRHAEQLRPLCSDAGLLCLRDGLLTLHQLKMFDGDALQALFSTHGLALLSLVRSADLIACFHAEQLRPLCSDAGLLCLRDGLLTLHQLKMFDGDALQALFSTHGVALLRLVGSADLIVYCHAEQIIALCSDAGLLSLREGIISLLQAGMVSGRMLTLLLTDGREFLRAGVIDFAQLAEFAPFRTQERLGPPIKRLRLPPPWPAVSNIMGTPMPDMSSDVREYEVTRLASESKDSAVSKLQLVFTSPTSGIELLQLLQLRDLLRMPEKELLFLLGPNVARCLVDGLVTADELRSCARTHREHILSDNGMALLSGKLFSFSELLQMPDEELLCLLSPNVARCLLDRLATVDELLSCARSHREHILSDSGMALLSGKVFSFSEMQQLPLGVVKLLTSSDAVVRNILHEGLLSAEDCHMIPPDLLPCFLSDDGLYMMRNSEMGPLQLLAQALEFHICLRDPSFLSPLTSLGLSQFLRIERKKIVEQSCNDDGFDLAGSDMNCASSGGEDEVSDDNGDNDDE